MDIKKVVINDVEKILDKVVMKSMNKTSDIGEYVNYLSNLLGNLLLNCINTENNLNEESTNFNKMILCMVKINLITIIDKYTDGTLHEITSSKMH